MRASSIALTVAISLAGPAFGQSVESPNVKLTLDWAFQGPQSVYLYGAEKGAFKKEGINVTIDRGSGSGDVMTRVASGAYDFGWADIATMVKFNAENPERKLIAVYVTGGNSPLAVITVDGRGIKAPKDLEGKKLGSTPGSAAMILFDIFAGKAGLDPKKVTWQQVSGQLREPMMVRGDVAAVAGFTTSSIMSVVELGTPLDKVVVMRYNDFGVAQYGTAIVTRPEFLAKNPKTTLAMVKAINASFKDAIVDPKASVAAIKARDSLVNLETECIRLTEGLETLTLTEEFKKGGLSSIDDARMKGSIDEILLAYNLKTTMPLDTVFTPAFLPPQAERMPPPLGSCK